MQVPAILLIADFTQYWVHRTFHAVPLLWPFHAIHHSAEQMDWLAGSRLHLVDVIVTRGASARSDASQANGASRRSGERVRL